MRLLQRKKEPIPAEQKEPATRQNLSRAADPEVPPASPTARFYPNAHAHLLDELRWLNRLLVAHVLRLRRAHFYEGLKDFRGFFIADDEIDALIAAGIFEADGKPEDNQRTYEIEKVLKQARSLREEIDRRLQESVAQKIFLPLVQISSCFHLNEFERQTLLVCIAPQVDARYEKLFAYLQNDITKKSPTVDLLLNLFCQTVEERLSCLHYFYASSGLRHHNLIESAENDSSTSAAQHFLRADSRIVQYVLGNKVLDQRLLPHLQFASSLHWNDVVIPGALQDRLRKLLQATLDQTSDQRVILYMHGRPGVGKKTIARALCGEAGVALAVADIRLLLRAPETFADKVRLVLREGLLQPCAIYFDHLEKLENAESENSALVTALAREIHTLGWLTFLSSENPLPPALPDGLPICPVEIPSPDFARQKELWKVHLAGIRVDDNLPDVDQLTARFDLTSGQIARAVHRAKHFAFARDPQSGAVMLSDLMTAIRQQSQPKLTSLARKVEPKFRWEELVLPEDHMLQLRELANQVKHRQRVLGEWGFATKLSLGRGLNALFAGPSGTGKTMAAEVIASDLALDLYKIDLSAVVSKYIGETEKNLSRVFAEAEHSNAILFFDEADALFGKRSDVRDAHDRYANIEIAYLLQRMEEYEGITVLATNLRQNIDEAFTRRIRFIVEFPFPDELYRARIWEGIWPKETPIAPEVDLHFMARQFKLTGGNIRNIALAAAFLASQNGQVIAMKHLLQATKREIQKMGKVIRQEEFDQYGTVSA
jgi:SpoVK/Ycf46/Vps4 family AAA+-type ATPase